MCTYGLVCVWYISVVSVCVICVMCERMFVCVIWLYMWGWWGDVCRISICGKQL